jgi:membrane protein implicated in regulation of membrane protease activity
LLLFTGLTALLVAAIASLATGIWWFLAGVLLLHLAAFAVAMLPVFRVLDDSDKPDPVTEARLREEGTSEQ